jgi:hypothetical protein
MISIVLIIDFFSLKAQSRILVHKFSNLQIIFQEIRYLILNDLPEAH